MSNSQQNVQANRKEQAVYLQSGDPTKERRPATDGLGNADSYGPGQLGQRFSAPDSTTGYAADWQIVKTDSVMDTLPYDGAVAWWLDRAAYLVTTNVTAAGRGNRAGIFRDSDAPQDPTVHNIGLSQIICIQKKGVGVQVNFVAGPVADPTAAGLFVIPSATAAQADCLAAGTAAIYPPIGVSTGAIDAVAVDYAAVDVDVDDNV